MAAGAKDDETWGVRVPDVLRGLRRSPRRAPDPADGAQPRQTDVAGAGFLAEHDGVYPADRDVPAVAPPDAVIPATRSVTDEPAADQPARQPAEEQEVSAAAEAPADSG